MPIRSFMPSVPELPEDPPTPETVFDLSDDEEGAVGSPCGTISSCDDSPGDEDHEPSRPGSHNKLKNHRHMTLTKEQEEGWAEFWHNHCKLISTARQPYCWLAYIERLAHWYTVALDTTGQEANPGLVILSCWFCQAEGAEYSFYPEDSGMLAIMPIRNGEGDRNELQVFDQGKSIILCIVSASGGL